MRVVPTLARATLPTPALLARATRDGWLVITSTDVVVLDASLVRRGAVAVPAGPAPDDAALVPAGDAVVLALALGLVCIVLQSGAERWRLPGRFHACRVVGDALWAVSRVDQHHVELAVHDLATGATDLAITLEDPYGAADVSLHDHPAPGTAVVWIAAGQDGQHSLLVTDEGLGWRHARVPPDNTLPPVFTSAGDTYLAATDDRLELRNWPAAEVLDDLRWGGGDDDDEPVDRSGDEPDQSGSHVDVLPGGYGCWSSGNGRLYLLDLTGLYVEDELTIEGHPLQPVSALYPTLPDEQAPCTDFDYAERGPDGLILTVHANVDLAVTRAIDWVGAAATR